MNKSFVFGICSNILMDLDYLYLNITAFASFSFSLDRFLCTTIPTRDCAIVVLRLCLGQSVWWELIGERLEHESVV